MGCLDEAEKDAVIFSLEKTDRKVFGSTVEERGHHSVWYSVLCWELGLALATGFSSWEQQGRASLGSAQFISQLLTGLQEKQEDVKAAPGQAAAGHQKCGLYPQNC